MVDLLSLYRQAEQDGIGVCRFTMGGAGSLSIAAPDGSYAIAMDHGVFGHRLARKRNRPSSRATAKRAASIIGAPRWTCGSSREQLSGLQDMEYRIIGWASGAEKKERSIMNELLADAGKYQKLKIPCDGYDFENYVANLLQENAFKSVRVTPKSNDYGADIMAEKDGVSYVFQCKYYTDQVGISAVQEIYSAKSRYNAYVAVVVTNSVYTTAAKVLAHELNVVLWDCKKLFELTRNTGTAIK